MKKINAKVVLGVAVLIVAILFIPFPTQLSPDFTVRFVDDAGNPIKGMEVQRTCTHFTYNPLGSVCPEDWDNPKRTDDNGNVSFTANYVWYGAASRIVRSILSYISLLFHGGVGRRVTLFPQEPDGFASVGWFNIDPDNPQAELVMKRKPQQ